MGKDLKTFKIQGHFPQHFAEGTGIFYKMILEMDLSRPSQNCCRCSKMVLILGNPPCHQGPLVRVGSERQMGLQTRESESQD